MRTAHPTTLLLIFLGLFSAVLRADDSASTSAEPLRIKLEVSKGPYFVGQGIVLTLGVIGGADRPKVEPPKVPGAEVWPIGTDVKPLSVSGIGTTISQENLFLARFRLVPRKPGTLEIPVIRAESDGRSGRTKPIALNVQSPPLEGRSSSFLGGVGTFSAQAEAEPTTLRVGQELEFRIRIDGPAAWGSLTGPTLERFDKIPLGLRVVPSRNELTPEPASRSFVYRIRPTQAGEVSLPPILVSAFDPKLGRYITKATSGVPIRVAAVAEFDPKSVTYQPIEKPRLSRKARWSLIVGSAVLVGVGLTAAWWLIRRWRRSRWAKGGPDVARRFAAKTARDLANNAAIDPAEASRKITEALIRYLERGSGRPPGALTPVEAGQGVADLTGSPELGDRAEQLLSACDRTLYGTDQAPAPVGPSLLDEAAALFRKLAR